MIHFRVVWSEELNHTYCETITNQGNQFMHDLSRLCQEVKWINKWLKVHILILEKLSVAEGMTSCKYRGLLLVEGQWMQQYLVRVMDAWIDLCESIYIVIGWRAKKEMK